MFAEPTKNKNPLLSGFINSEPRVAAWLLPMPGKNEHNGEKIADAKPYFKNCFFSSFIFFKGTIDCFFGIVFDFKLVISPERPKRPESKGRRGSLTGRLKVKSPRNPAKMKIAEDRIKLSSLNMIYRERKINRKGIIVFISS